MAEVAASVALSEAGTPPATPAPAAKTVAFSDGRTVSFADTADSADPADAILDEVLAGEAPQGASEADGAHTAEEAGATPAPATEKKTETPDVKTEPNDIEAAKLRRGYAKLAEERQRVVELQNQARAEKAAAQGYAAKAQKHDELIASIESDPAGFLHSHGGEALVQKALQGFIDMEKSPAEREVAKLRQENNQREAERVQRETERVAAEWRNGIITKVQADDRFDIVNAMGLQGRVIDVITGYYEKHSERNDKGEVTKPAILSWDVAAQAVEETEAGKLEKSKRYGKRAPAAAEATPPAKKDTPPAKQQQATAKKAPTSLSSVPVAESPATADDLSLDPETRQAQILAEMGL